MKNGARSRSKVLSMRGFCNEYTFVIKGLPVDVFAQMTSAIFNSHNGKKVFDNMNELVKAMSGKRINPEPDSLFIIPTPNNIWGWIFETYRGGRLIWVPEVVEPGEINFGGIAVIEGIDSSSDCFKHLNKVRDIAIVDKPEWLEAALLLAIPLIGCWETNYFAEALGSAPAEYLGGFINDLSPDHEQVVCFNRIFQMAA